MDSPPIERTNGIVADNPALFTNRSGSWRWRRVEEEGFHGPTCESTLMSWAVHIEKSTPVPTAAGAMFSDSLNLGSIKRGFFFICANHSFRILTAF